MHIKIDDQHTVGDIKKEFNSQLPNLKLEFYSKPHGDHQGSPKDFMIPDDAKVGDIRTVHNDVDFHFDKSFKVNDLEHLFEESFGLFIQVFRKSGDIWLQTTTTDGWTLEKQNEEAFASRS